ARRPAAARAAQAGGSEKKAKPGGQAGAPKPAYQGRGLVRIFTIIMLTTALGGIAFQSTTFALPKVFDERLSGLAISATLVGWYAFLVFAVAAIAQLVVGYMLDRYPARNVFIAVAGLQALFFGLMPGLNDWAALGVAVAFMLAVFGQIPINDVLVGRLTASAWRSRVFACRYIVTFSALAASIPMIGWLHATYGFDALFELLTGVALAILALVILLPRAIPARQEAAAAAR
ncbi:MAG: MFS transporter, partial [Alphaproteobacteria bacterium]